MHVTEFLDKPDEPTIGPAVAMAGPPGALKQMALAALEARLLDDEDDSAPTRFDGRTAELKSVLDELRTLSMWGDCRLAVVDEADEFVKNHRAALESYLDRPARKSVLVLDVKSWPKNTRLAKAIAEIGLTLDCSELSGGRVIRWLTDSARNRHGKQLGRDAAALIVELAGSDAGLLDQELGKLAAYVGDRPRIEGDDVRTLVGGWKAETTWVMIAALQQGDLGRAIECLDRLLTANEAPQKILGGIGFAFRRLARATESSRRGTPLHAALKDAGIYRGDEVRTAETYLRRIGRPRAERIHDVLLAADGGLKGNSRIPERLQMERLLVELSGKA